VCNFPNGACPAVPAAPETCVIGGGQPKYGDYNGNACANGRVYAAWASATPPPWIGGVAGNISIYSDVIPRPAPTVTTIFPTKTTFGPAVPVTITGTNFNGMQSASPTVNPRFVSATLINATIPANLPSGPYNVTVTTPSGSSLPPNTVNFNVEPIVNSIDPKMGPFTGGTSVMVTGSGFAVPGIGSFTTTHFLVGGVDAGQPTCSGTTCTISTPAANPGKVDIQACVSGVCSGIKRPDDQFEYTAPSISGLSPSHGPITGGTWVSVNGMSLVHDGSLQVLFGDVKAMQTEGCAPIFSSETCISALSPQADHGPGPVKITAMIAGTPNTLTGDNTFT
jgi:hypothetical protein